MQPCILAAPFIDTGTKRVALLDTGLFSAYLIDSMRDG